MEVLPYLIFSLILVSLLFVGYQEAYGNPGRHLDASCLNDDISIGNPLSMSGYVYPFPRLNCNYPTSTRYGRVKRSRWCDPWYLPVA